jgi:hypothetical protein
MAKVRDQHAIIILNIIYGNNHFEPTNKCNNVTNFPIISNHDACNNIVLNIKLNYKMEKNL